MDKPMATGARLSLEVHTPGEPVTWTAVGRVVWMRDAAGADGQAPGMGVGFIDVDDAGLAAIGRALARSASEPAIDAEAARPPSRERTVLGVGLAAAPQVAAAPIVTAAPSRERTALGIAPAAAAQREPPAIEQSIPIELAVPKAPATPSPVPAVAPEASSSLHPAGVPRRGRGGRLLLLLVIVSAAGAGGYVYRASLRARCGAVVARAVAQIPSRWLR
jgi:hypothetical protein